MWSFGVIALSPMLYDVFGLFQRRKQVFVQALVPYATIKRLDKAVLAWFSGFDKLKINLGLIGPIEHSE